MLRKASLTVFFILFAALLLYFFLRNNVHTVIPNEIYRSAQLSPGNLAYLIERYHIKSVLNLRGPQNKANWYQPEVKTTERLGAKHYDIAMWAYKPASAKNIHKLIKVLLEAPKPLLMHCQGGSDRTGLASAIALILFDPSVSSLQEIENQYSWYYLVTHQDTTGRLTMPHYIKWLHEHGDKSSRNAFIAWSNQLQV